MCSFENLTISEQAAARRPFPKTLQSDGDVELLFVGKVKSTSSPGLSLLTLHVDKPETSPLPTTHHWLPAELSHRATATSSTTSFPNLLQIYDLGAQNLGILPKSWWSFLQFETGRVEDYVDCGGDVVVGHVEGSNDVHVGVSRVDDWGDSANG
ncbi:hypothetical protein TB1_002044 [Malus domestica]